MTEVAIQVRGLRKSYGRIEAVRGVDFDVQAGEIFALLGPNGAGKTTTVEILEGHRKRSGGEVSVLGHDPGRNERALKERIGIVLQETGVERFLTVAEVIDQFRSYYPKPRARDEVVELVGLTEQRDTLVRRLSGGQQRRLDVAIGLAGDPELLFLDEPTTGFDPTARRSAWKMIQGLKGLGKTVLLTTHYMDEAQHLADRVAIIARGEIVAEGTPSSLTGRRDAPSRISFLLPPGMQPPAELGATLVDGWVELSSTHPVADLHHLTGWAIQEDVRLEGLTVAQPTLEDVFLDLTGPEDAAAEDAAERVR